jgi:hypothetical protein
MNPNKEHNMKTNKAAADICLYGTRNTGAGFIVCALKGGRTSGTGDPVKDRTFTEAVWMGVEHLRALGVTRGIVRIFDAGGDRVALADLANVPSFGELTWQTAPVNAFDLSV